MFKVFNKKSNGFTKRQTLQCPGPEPKTSTPNVSCAPQCGLASSTPNISFIERSCSVPILVSDASIADLESHLQKHTSFKTDKSNNTIFCTPRGSIKTSRCNDSKNSSCQASPRHCPLQESPRVCPRQESSRGCPRQGSPRHCPSQEHPSCPGQRPACYKSTDSRRCCGEGAHKRGVLKFAQLECPGNKTQKTKKLEKVDCECVEEIYFNDEAKKSGCSSPRSCFTERSDAQRCKQTPSEFFAQLRKGLKCCSSTKMRKDSGATCSLVDSSTATCDASFYHSKLLATLQILQNKEETIGVQADSLAVAEERIATLTERANDLKKELDRKTKEYQTLRKIGDCCKVVKHDVCVITDRPMEDQRAIVTTLENNLSVIEELYRECFYETAKQENLIEMLRSSYLDVRLMEKQKADQIGHLQTVIDKQKWSIDIYQDIASEVDGLKTEISNFLTSTTSTSTNHDSGMWERSEDSLSSVPAVQDDLQEVTEQLLRLQDLLALGCSCGLMEENMKLKKEAEGLRIKMSELQQKLCGLEGVLALKNDADLKFQTEIEMKHQELAQIRDQLARSQEDTCDAMNMQLRRTKALLDEKTEFISQLKQEKECQAEKIQQLQEELEKADSILKENCKMRSEVSYLSAQVELWRAQLEDSQRHVCALDQELAKTRAHTQEIDACYREKVSAVAELQSHLEQAYARGAALCGESRRAVCAVRTWMRRMRDKHRELEGLLKERDALLEILRRRLEERQCGSQHTCSTCEKLAPCSKCQSSRDDRSFTSKQEPRRQPSRSTSPSEMPSCSSTPTALRVLRNKEAAAKRCKAWMCDTAIQLPERRESGSDAAPLRPGCCGLRPPRPSRHVRLSRGTLQLHPPSPSSSPRRGPLLLQAVSSSCAPVQLPCAGPSSSCEPIQRECAGPSSSCAPIQLQCAGPSSRCGPIQLQCAGPSSSHGPTQLQCASPSPGRTSLSPGRRPMQLQESGPGQCGCQSPPVSRGCPGRAVSPTEELLQRVEQLSEALADGSRRWRRGRDTP